LKRARLAIRLGMACALVAGAGCVSSQTQPGPAADPVVMDRAVAVVNRQVILESDIEDEIRLSVLDPNLVGQKTLTPKAALDQLISRALVEQQMSPEDAAASSPPQAEVDARLSDIRKELPACVHENCATDAGWKAFLSAHGLAMDRVAAYLTYRLKILRFIELRFRPAIRVDQSDIEDYYRKTLVPQYAPGDAVPPLDQVSARIEEILLQQQVNLLFDQWLNNLRSQGDVEILDPALEDSNPSGAAQGSPGSASKIAASAVTS
jgi:hypothetical protein